MRALVQRVARATVSVDGVVVGTIGYGLLVFLGVGSGDTEDDVAYLTDKIAHLRVFTDDSGKFNLSALDTGGQGLLVSQFTLYADTRRGRAPSFPEAAPPQEAEPLFQQTAALLRQQGLQVETGTFQQHMMVELINDGPVTIWLDSADRLRHRG